MQRLCDDCQGVFKNKQSLHAHQNRTGHQQHGIANNEGTSIAAGAGRLEDGEVSLSEALSDTVEDVSLLQESLKHYTEHITELFSKYDALKVSVDSFNNTLNRLSNWSEDQWKNALGVIATVDAANTKKFSKLHICPDCGAPLHLHRVGEHVNKSLGDGIWSGEEWHLECLVCGYCTTNYKYPKWKEQKNLFNPKPAEGK